MRLRRSWNLRDVPSRAESADPFGAALLGREPGEVMMVATHTADLMGAKRAGMKTAYIHVEEEWTDVFPTPEPVHPLSEFDAAARSWTELVEKLT